MVANPISVFLPPFFYHATALIYVEDPARQANVSSIPINRVRGLHPQVRRAVPNPQLTRSHPIAHFHSQVLVLVVSHALINMMLPKSPFAGSFFKGIVLSQPQHVLCHTIPHLNGRHFAPDLSQEHAAVLIVFSHTSMLVPRRACVVISRFLDIVKRDWSARCSMSENVLTLPKVALVRRRGADFRM